MTMKNSCLFTENDLTKKDLIPVLRAIVHKFGLPRQFDADYVAASFSALMNSLRLCIATSTNSYPLDIREIGHCVERK